MDKTASENKFHKNVYLTPEKRELGISMNEGNWPKGILDKIMWFHSQGILEYTDFQIFN